MILLWELFLRFLSKLKYEKITRHRLTNYDDAVLLV